MEGNITKPAGIVLHDSGASDSILDIVPFNFHHDALPEGVGKKRSMQHDLKTGLSELSLPYRAQSCIQRLNHEWE